jgi:NAD+ kinase
MNPLKNIAIVSNLSKTGARDLAHSLEKICHDYGVKSRLTEEFPCPQNFLKDMDACFSVGGDGTLLNLLDQAIEYEVPVAGVGLGKLGFLATLYPDDLARSLPPVLRGEFQIRRRSLIGYRENQGNEKLALNDLVVKSGATGRLGRFSVFCGNERVADYASDGIVFSTPTGSTAYNLAAGGPIAHPEAEVILMTPISAHSLTSRPLVFPAGISLQIECEGDSVSADVSTDGREAFTTTPQFPLEIFVSRKSFPLMETIGHSHFRVLRNKLKWG